MTTAKLSARDTITALYKANCISAAAVLAQTPKQETVSERDRRLRLIAGIIATVELEHTASAEVKAAVWKRLWGKVHKELTRLNVSS